VQYLNRKNKRDVGEDGLPVTTERQHHFHSLTACGSYHFMRMELPRTTAVRSQQRCSSGTGLHAPLTSLYALPDKARTGFSIKLTRFDC